MRENPLLLIILLFIVVMLTITNIGLFKKIRDFYRQLNGIQLDPYGIQRYPSLPILKEPARQTVVFFGDSRAEQWPFPQDDRRFQFINRGIGGQTSVQALGRFDAHIAPLQPDIIVLQVGVNDLKNLGLFPDQHATILANCKNAIRQIVSQADDCGAQVILTTIFPIGNVSLAQQPFWRMFIAETPLIRAIDEVNTFLLTLQSEHVIILNTQSILADQRGRVKKEFQHDLLHLNQDGYTALNQALHTILAAL